MGHLAHSPHHGADGWAARFKLLSDPTRLELCRHLHHHPDATVKDIAAAVGVSQNTATYSLRALANKGWVSGTKQGRYMHYRLNDSGLHTLIHHIDGH